MQILAVRSSNFHTLPLNSPASLIRSFRQKRQLSLEFVAWEAGITPLALSNFELRSACPRRENLLRILDALDKVAPLSIADRRSVLDPLGYQDVPSLPNQIDTDRALEAWQATFKDSPYPTYLSDIGQRIHEGNAQANLLVFNGLQQLKPLTVFDLLCAPRLNPSVSLANEHEVAVKTLALLQTEGMPYSQQPWYQELLADATSRYPALTALYQEASGAISLENAVIEPIILANAEGTLLRFRAVRTEMASDTRFRITQYIPLDRATILYLLKAI